MVVKMGVGGIGWGVVEDEARDVVVIFKVFSYFLVDRELDLVRELFLALGRRAHKNKHAVPF